jgi:hypothetical protein
MSTCPLMPATVLVALYCQNVHVGQTSVVGVELYDAIHSG